MISELLTGGGLTLAGVLVGRFMPARHRTPKAKAVEPICGCDHHRSFHDPGTGECHAMMYVPGTMSRDSYHKPCTCRQYSGPEPLPEFYAPQITNEAQQ